MSSSADVAAATTAFDPDRVTADSFPHATSELRCLETHISWVFLTGHYAYKVKKPVQLDYLDFSTLERRRYFCHRELTLNHRLAPELYVDVVPIGGAADAPRFGDYPALDYAVRMRQFHDDSRLDRLLDAGRFDDAMADQLGDTVARLHAAAATVPENTRYGSVNAIVVPLIDNFRALRATLGKNLSDRLAEQCRHDIALARRLRPRFRQRRRHGSVRDCHGDLHLANLVCRNERIVPFDRLEFDPALRWIDVFNEAAFPFMDLASRRRPDLAFGYLNRYLERTGDYVGLTVLPVYAAYKALIRAKIAAATAVPDGHHLDSLLSTAKRLSRPVARRLILMHGLSCSGKSSVAAELMRGLPAIRLRADVERKRRAGLAAAARSGSAVAAGLYTESQTVANYRHLADLAATVLTAGYDVIVDATFLRRAERRRFIGLATVHGVAARILVCEAPLAALRSRIDARADGHRSVSEADREVLEWQLTRREPLNGRERRIATVVDTSVAQSRTALLSAASGDADELRSHRAE
ncbi:MAG: AAA family ATPase [Pseudomonadota bacterium]